MPSAMSAGIPVSPARRGSMARTPHGPESRLRPHWPWLGPDAAQRGTVPCPGVSDGRANPGTRKEEPPTEKAEDAVWIQQPTNPDSPRPKATDTVSPWLCTDQNRHRDRTRPGIARKKVQKKEVVRVSEAWSFRQTRGRMRLSHARASISVLGCRRGRGVGCVTD